MRAVRTRPVRLGASRRALSAPLMTVGAVGVVVLGPPTVLDSANIDQFNF